MLDQLLRARVAQRHAGCAEEQLSLALAQSHLLGAELEQPSARAQRRKRQRRSDAPGRDEHRSLDLVVDQGSDRLERRPGPQDVEVVEHEHDRVPRRDLRGQPRNRRRPDCRRRLAECVNEPWVERLVPHQRSRDVAEQDDGVVVPVVERDPRKRARVPRGPLGQECGLPVAGRRDDGRDRDRGGCPQPVDEHRPRDRSGPKHRYLDLRLQELERLLLRRKLEVGAGARARLGSRRPGLPS